MKDGVIMNAIIESVSLTMEDHGLLSSWLYLSYGGTSQGFGGYSLYLPKSFKHHKADAGYAGHWIARCLEVADVTSWDKLKGKTIRVRKTDEWGSIISIGHIVKDIWFTPSIEFKEALEKEPA